MSAASAIITMPMRIQRPGALTSEWLTASDYMKITGCSLRTLRRRVAAKEIDTCVAGGGQMLYAAPLTGTELRMSERMGRTAVEEKARTSEIMSAERPAPALSLAPLFHNYLSDTRQALSASQQAEAERRLNLIRPLLEYAASAPGGAYRAAIRQLRLRDGRAVTTSDLLAEHIAESSGESGRTLRRWKSEYVRAGHDLHALAPKERRDKGESRWFSRFPAARTIVLAEYLKPFGSQRDAWKAIRRQRELLGIAPDDLPSYETVRAWLANPANVPAPIAVFARDGERKHQEQMDEYLRRGYLDVAVNQIWVSDHSILDVFVWNDVFPAEGYGKRMRLRLTMLLDMRSRKAVGWSVTPEGSSRSIATALRRAVNAWGPASIFLCDNGKDFQKAARGADPANGESILAAWAQSELDAISQTGIIARLGMAVQYCIKYHPQSKLIERFFGTLHSGLDRLFPGYTSPDAYHRPDFTEVALAEHDKLLREGTPERSKLIPASRFIAILNHWISEEYNAGHHHSGEGMNGRTPNQVWDAGYDAAKRRTVEPEILDRLLMERKEALVRECSVTLNRTRYIGATPDDAERMYLANKQRLVIWHDANDPGAAIATNRDNRVVARLVAETLVPHGPAAGPMIEASMADRRRRRNATADAVRQVHREARLMGHKSQVQAWHEQAQIPASVSDVLTHRPQSAPEPQPTRQYTHDIAADFLRDVATKEEHE